MRFPTGNSFAHRMTIMALVASSVASATLMAAFLALRFGEFAHQLESRLSTLANIVGQNSTAALLFDDRTAAVEVLHALEAEGSVVSACLYGQTGGCSPSTSVGARITIAPRRSAISRRPHPGW